MKKLNSMYPGPLTITEDSVINGMVSGDVTVAPGVEVVINGMISGNVIVETGARASINGMVCGTLRNHGGEIEQRGLAGGISARA